MSSKIYDGLDERAAVKAIVADFANHKVPEYVDPLRHPLSLVYCFGGVSFFLILLLVLTGAFMALLYIPTPALAQSSIKFIEEQVPLGGLIRGVHRWSAAVLLLMMGLHMARVYVHGAYRKPRELNWLTGVALLSLVLMLGLTGYLLRWDVQAYALALLVRNTFAASPVVGPLLAGLFVGGSPTGEFPLSRGFTVHVWLLPLAIALLLVLHFSMVRKHGISESL